MVHGKSTLAKLISGLLFPQKGQILIDDILTSNKRENINIRKKIGIVFQNPENQIIFNNVYDDIAFAIKNLGLDNVDERIKGALDKVRMKEYINKPTYELSLGQKQRIAISSILAVNPRYIVFDEPTTMLDSEGKDDVYKIIKELSKIKYSTVYITNAINEILLSDKIVVMEKGKIIKIFNKIDILENIDFLEEHGFRLPMELQILNQMKNKNIDLNLLEWTIEEMTEKIIEVLKNEKCN